MAHYAKSAQKTDAVFKFLKDFYKEKGYMPTVREIVAQSNCDIKSTASAKTYIDRLVMEGRLIKSDNKNRALKIVGLDNVDDFIDIDNSNSNMTVVPFLGNTAAGEPLYAATENDRSYSLPNDFFSLKGQNFLLQVKGESMRDIGILDGDIVLIKSQNTANNGQIVVAQIDNEAVTLKRYYNCSSYIKLHPENSDMDDIIVTQDHSFRILGIATGLMRNHIR